MSGFVRPASQKQRSLLEYIRMNICRMAWVQAVLSYGPERWRGAVHPTKTAPPRRAYTSTTTEYYSIRAAFSQQHRFFSLADVDYSVSISAGDDSIRFCRKEPNKFVVSATDERGSAGLGPLGEYSNRPEEA